MDNWIVTCVGEQIAKTGCTSGKQSMIDENQKDVEVAWELKINIL